LVNLSELSETVLCLQFVTDNSHANPKIVGGREHHTGSLLGENQEIQQVSGTCMLLCPSEPQRVQIPYLGEKSLSSSVTGSESKQPALTLRQILGNKNQTKKKEKNT